MLQGIIGTISGLVDKAAGILPPTAALIGVLQIAGGKFIKKYTTEETPNEIIMPFTIAIAMVGWMLVNAGAHPNYNLQQLAEAALWPAMKQYAGVTALHQFSRNGSTLAKLGNGLVGAALGAVPGGSIVGKIIGFFKK